MIKMSDEFIAVGDPDTIDKAVKSHLDLEKPYESDELLKACAALSIKPQLDDDKTYGLREDEGGLLIVDMEEYKGEEGEKKHLNDLKGR